MSHVPVLPAVPPVLLSEPPALNLVNTRVHLPDGWVDLLDDPEHRTTWLTAQAAQLGIAAELSAVDDAVAEALKVVREQVAATLEPARHGRKPPAHELSGLNEAVRAAPAVPQARWDGSTLATTSTRAGSLATRLAGGFAEAAIELLTDETVRRVRRCDAPACTVLFLARNPKRRWCTPNVCGNRARVARYYLRHKASGPETGTEADPAADLEAPS